MKKKILIIGDSSVMPRDDVGYMETYIYHLRENHDNFHVINKSQRGHSVDDIYANRKDYLTNGFNPDIIIFHYGIVDSFPRPIPSGRKINYIYQLLAYVKIDFDTILKKIKLYYLFSNIFNFKTVNINVFKNKTYDLVNIAKNIGAKKIILLGIIKPSKILNRVKIAQEEVNKYNKIFQQIATEHEEVTYIDNYDMTDLDTLWDGHHFTATGMFKIYKKIIEII